MEFDKSSILSREGLIAYLNATIRACGAGLIQYREALERFQYILPVVDDAHIKSKLIDILHQSPSDTNREDRPAEGGLEIVSSNWSWSKHGRKNSPLDILEFMVRTVAGLAKWVFCIGDDDFRPSIPHGHYKSRNEKLNPYVGNVYHDGDLVRQEKRELINALWNDDKFRDFTARAIDGYIARFPNVHWWPRHVKNPQRLPRRQRQK